MIILSKPDLKSSPFFFFLGFQCQCEGIVMLFTKTAWQQNDNMHTSMGKNTKWDSNLICFDHLNIIIIEQIDVQVKVVLGYYGPFNCDTLL